MISEQFPVLTTEILKPMVMDFAIYFPWLSYITCQIQSRLTKKLLRKMIKFLNIGADSPPPTPKNGHLHVTLHLTTKKIKYFLMLLYFIFLIQKFDFYFKIHVHNRTFIL